MTDLEQQLFNMLYRAAEQAAREGRYDPNRKVYTLEFTEECFDQLVRLNTNLSKLPTDSRT